MTFRSKVPKESPMERFERQATAYKGFLQHLSDRTQVARELIAKEAQSTKTKET